MNIEDYLYGEEEVATPDQLRTINELMDWLPLEEEQYKNYRLRMVDLTFADAQKILNDLFELKEIVLNPRYGGGGLSPQAFKKYMKDNLGIIFD